MQRWKATTRHGITRKKGIQRWKAYSKTGYKETKDVRCLLTLDLKLFWSQVKEMHSTAKEFRGLTVRGKKNCWHWDPYNINSDRWIMEPIKTTGRSPAKKKKVEPVQPFQMSNYQGNNYRKDLGWLHFTNELREGASVEPTAPHNNFCSLYNLSIKVPTRSTRPEMATVFVNVSKYLFWFVLPAQLVREFRTHPPPARPPLLSLFPKIPHFLEVEDVLTFYRPTRKTKVLITFLTNLYIIFILKVSLLETATYIAITETVTCPITIETVMRIMH